MPPYVTPCDEYWGEDHTNPTIHKVKTYRAVANALIKAANTLTANESNGSVVQGGHAMSDETKEKTMASMMSAPDGTNYLSDEDFRKILNESVKDAGPVLQMLADYDAMDN